MEYISKIEERELIKEAQSGSSDAIMNLINAHNDFLNFIVSINTPKELKHDSDSIYQESVIAFMEAIHKFKLEYNLKLLTFAKPWVEGAVKRYLQDNRLIRIPIYKLEQMKKITNFRKEYVKKNFIYPTNSEIAEGLGVSVEKICDTIKELQNTHSIDFQYDNDMSLSSTVEDDSVSFEEDLETKNCKEILMGIMKNFKDRERDVLLRRFGFIDGESKTLQQIGEIYGVTKERIRQIEINALKKFRIEKNIKQIEAYKN